MLKTPSKYQEKYIFKKEKEPGESLTYRSIISAVNKTDLRE